MELKVGDKFYDTSHGVGVINTITDEYVYVTFDGDTYRYENPNIKKTVIPKNTIHYVYSDYHQDWVLDMDEEDVIVRDGVDIMQIERPEDAVFIHMKEGYSTGEIIMVRIGGSWFPSVPAYFIGDDACVLEDGLLNGEGIERYSEYKKI